MKPFKHLEYGSDKVTEELKEFSLRCAYPKTKSSALPARRDWLVTTLIRLAYAVAGVGTGYLLANWIKP